METQTKLTLSSHFTILAISFLLTATSFLLQGHVGLELSDEGFLWYGAQRTALGEVPIRDFMSYDPGRYYWSAFFMSLFDDLGIVSLRIGIAAFQFLGLTLGLYLINSKQKLGPLNTFYLLLTGLTILLWMNPRHKIFDCSLSIILVATLANMLRHFNARSCFLGGIVLGLVAVFGRNHGVYGLLGSTLLFTWISLNSELTWRQITRLIVVWIFGIFVGYLPIFFLILNSPGFLQSFIDSIKFLFEFGATNLPLPVPWPWRVNSEALNSFHGLSQFFSGTFFVVVLTIALSSVTPFIQRWRSKPQKMPSSLIACLFMAAPYAHYAFSRADFSHLAQGVQPALLAIIICVASLSLKKRMAFSILLLAITFITCAPHQPLSKCDGTKCQETLVFGDTIKLPISVAKTIALLADLELKYGSPNTPFLVAPFWPGAYAIFNKKSPIQNIYPILPRSREIQLQETARLHSFKISFALISNYPLDGRDSLRFKNTYPLIISYLRTNFVQLSVPTDKSGAIFVRKGINE